MDSLINRAEIRRLEKAAKDKDKIHLAEWAQSLENAIKSDLKKEYDKEYHDRLLEAIDNFLVALAYILHFSEHTKFGRNRLTSFMQDLFETVDLFRTGEYNPDEYKKILKEYGIVFSDYKYQEKQDKD